MGSIEEIENAISVHTAWLKNIKAAVAVCAMSGANSNPILNEKTITRVKADNQCSFGKWLYETIEPELEKSIHYKEIVTLHAQFHQQAANILSLAFKGQKSKASSLVLNDSNFIQCSNSLIDTLTEWKKSL